MKLKWILLATILAAPVVLRSEETNSAPNAELEALKKEVQLLEQKIERLEKQQAAQQNVSTQQTESAQLQESGSQ